MFRNLEERKSNQLLRTLRITEHLVDFASNDYLGFARSEALRTMISEKTKIYGEQLIGATGSRLISGNSAFLEELEYLIARYHRAEAGLIFNSGYDANLGFFSCIAQKGDTLITDESIHASIIDGTRLSYAQRFRFKHNDLDSLEKKLKQATGHVFVAVESVYSMDGDIAPLVEICDLTEQYHAHLIVDEAHATGIFGDGGRGLVCDHRLEDKVFARIHTFGKALGVHGAIILGSSQLRDYLINFARSFIYTTALPFHALLAIESAYHLLPYSKEQRLRLQQHIAFFREQSQHLPFEKLNSQSPIQGIVITGNEAAKTIAQKLESKGYYAKAILSPTVPAGKERLRICLHVFNTQEEISDLLHCLQNP